MDKASLKSILRNLVRDEQRYPALQQVKEELLNEWEEPSLLGKTNDETLINVAKYEGRKEALNEFFRRIEGHAQVEAAPKRPLNEILNNPNFND